MPAHFPAGSPALTFSSGAKTGHTYSSRGSWKTFYLIRGGPHNTAALLLLHWKEIIGQNCVRSALSLGGLRAVGRAAALTFARVFGFATVVACLASAFAFARVLALASVFFLYLILGLVLRRRSQPRKEVRRLDGRAGTGKQTR